MLLITPSEVINYAFTPRETINPNSIRALKIDIAQEHFIRARLGQELYDQLLENKHTELTEHYIKPALAQFVRYGVIGELAIEVSDRGALVYSSSSGRVDGQQNKAQDTIAQNEQSKESNSTTSSDTKNTVVETTNEVKDTSDERVTSNGSNPDYTDVDNHRIQSQGDISLNANSTTTAATTAIGDEKHASTDSQKQTNSAQENTVRHDEQLRAASPAELRVLAQRALSDGNILLAKAIRHIERNLDLYPSYIASSFSSRIFF